jgi:hypothetical protein
MVSLYEMRIDNQIYRTLHFLGKSAQKYRCTFWEKVPKNTVALHFLKKSAQKYR